MLGTLCSGCLQYLKSFFATKKPAGVREGAEGGAEVWADGGVGLSKLITDLDIGEV